ncbi:hypothetical protein KCV06_g433, partial [Aureobasidium melanogenum]
LTEGTNNFDLELSSLSTFDYQVISSYMLLRRCWTHRISVAPVGIRARCYSSAHHHGINLDQPVQSYISRSSDPYINLSIEHYLLQKSHPDSSILFLYVNRPSVIIGRNQNPWLEVNLGLLNAAQTSPNSPSRIENEPPGLGDVDLVRRRSGGGTVFHDGGNVNWTVISPAATFTRDKHAEMVTRALRSCGIAKSRVNERHDIVLDQGTSDFAGTWGPDDDTHATPWQSATIRPLKVSGSAYKLTRARALHHGTALLNSPNLHVISSYLRSPAKPYIKGRSVDSVSSPVGNILLNNDEFIQNVQREYKALYSGAAKAVELGDECLRIEEVKKGHAELSSLEWTYMQTPQFTFSDLPLKPEQKEGEIDYSDAKFRLDVRYGAVIASQLKTKDSTTQQSEHLAQLLEKKHLHEITDWEALFKEAASESAEAKEMARWVQSSNPCSDACKTVENGELKIAYCITLIGITTGLLWLEIFIIPVTGFGLQVVEVHLHAISVFTVGVVFGFGAVDLEAQGIAVEGESSLVGNADKGDRQQVVRCKTRHGETYDFVSSASLQVLVFYASFPAGW